MSRLAAIAGASIALAGCGLFMAGDRSLEDAVMVAEDREAMHVADRAGVEGDRICVIGPYADRGDLSRDDRR